MVLTLITPRCVSALIVPRCVSTSGLGLGRGWKKGNLEDAGGDLEGLVEATDPGAEELRTA